MSLLLALVGDATLTEVVNNWIIKARRRGRR